MVRTALPVALLLLALTILASLLLGRYPLAPDAVLRILAAQALPLDRDWAAAAEAVVLKVRLPRIGAAVLVGAALASAGAAFQGIFRNPLVSPDILGVSAGAGFGAATAILLGLAGPGIQMLAFLGGIIAVTAAWLVGVRRQEENGGALPLVLAGVVVGMVFHALTALLKYVADPVNTLPAITFWLMGSLASVTAGDLLAAAPPILAGMVGLWLLRWRLNVMAFGDEEARALGVDTDRTRLAVVACATLMTAAAVAISGVIGLVGLVVPHIARRLVGPNYLRLLPACALTGGLFLLVVDDAARSLASGEIPLGILTALIGAPFFVVLLLDTRKGWG
jgi:iron complex transport system permease protein